MMRAKPAKQRRATTVAANEKPTHYLVIGAVVLGVGALAWLLYLSIRDPSALEGLQRFAGLSRGHDEEATYEDTGLPPVGGIHSGIWQNCGIYDQPIETKNAVHSMEHGAVWIAYQPELPTDEVAELQDAARGEPYVLLSPYPGLESPVVLTAWGIQLTVDSAGDGRIADFIERYQLGPQTPELGASCQDGTGTPLS
jgi:hypothetical protein